MKAEELPIDVLEYFLNLLKLSKVYANFVSSLGHETIEEIDLKTVQLLNCEFTCAESSNVSGIYNLWYSCNNIWVGITVEEGKVSRELLRKECTKSPPYNFYVLFGGLIYPEEGEVVWTIQFGLKNKVPLSLRLNNLSFTLVNGISLYDGTQLTFSIWESTRGNYIDVNLLSFDEGLAKDRIHIDYEGNVEEYEKNLRRNPENAYRLAISLLTYLYNNQIFRDNVNEAVTFLRRFFSMYTAFLLY
jgi:hypothetical protein